MDKPYVRSDEYIPNKVIAKYFQIYSPKWNFDSHDDRLEFLKLYFKLAFEYHKRYVWRTETVEFTREDWDQDEDKRFTKEYSHELINLKEKSFFQIVFIIKEDYDSFLAKNAIKELDEMAEEIFKNDKIGVKKWTEL